MGFGCTGATQSGTAVSLMAMGAMNKYTNFKAAASLFRTKTFTYTPFQTEPMIVTANNPGRFGADIQFQLSSAGDGFAQMLLRVLLPGIKGVDNANNQSFPITNPCNPCADDPAQVCCDEDPEDIETCPDLNTCVGEDGCWASWTNAAGYALIDKVCLVVGHSVEDEQFGETMFMHEELNGYCCKKVGEMAGKFFHPSSLLEFSKQCQIEMYVPLTFHHSLTHANMFPLAAAQWHSVNVHLRTRPLNQMIIRNQRDQSEDGCEVVKCSDKQPITNNDVQLELIAHIVYLDMQERDMLNNATFKMLIKQHQYQTHETNGQSNVRIRLNFNFIVQDIIVAVRRKCHADHNQWFNFCGPNGIDPVVDMQLLLNNQPRNNVLPGKFFRWGMPYWNYNCMPDACLYPFSFATNPSDPSQPTGGINFSRIENADLLLNLDPSLGSENVEILVYANSWNILNFYDGLAGLGFSSAVNTQNRIP